MRIALAQIDTTVGDIEGNLARALDAVARARMEGADITLLPELVLTGYPPEDLVHKSHFVEDNLAALERLAQGCECTVIAGFVDRDGTAIYNAAAVLGDGRIQAIYHKRHLPNYGVFDEERYFERGSAPAQVEVCDTACALTICEDVWAPEIIAEAAGAGARVLLNISASPFHAGKGSDREAMLAQGARENGLWVAYCNLVGGQDELVYDGRSVVISPEGEAVARAASFEEDLLLVDIDPEGVSTRAPANIADLSQSDEEVYSALVLGLRDYARKNGFTDAVLGLSGGVDSALVATLACDALGAGHVHGVLMPSRFSSAGSIDDATTLAGALGIETRIIPIESVHKAFLDALEPSFAGHGLAGIAEENVQARVRGTLLMGLSNKFGWLALATGNKSELSVGYSTLYGDMVGGFAPIKDVFKMRVYALCRWRNKQAGRELIPEATLTKPPSAELRPDQLDQDSLPPYEVLDAILTRYVELDESREEIVAGGFDAATVDRAIALTDAAEYKRRQGPVGVKITAKAFGKDRRMPITNRYRG